MNRALSLCVGLLLLGLFGVIGNGLHAEPLLQVALDDPSNLIKGKPDGITSLGPEFRAKGATIGSGKGGRVLPQINSGPSNAVVPAGEWKIQVLTEPAFGTVPFTRLWLKGGSITREIGVSVLPDALENSLSSMVRYENGRTHFNGAFDLFLRAYSEDQAEPKISIQMRIGVLSMLVYLEPDDHNLYVRLSTSNKAIEVDGVKGGPKNMINAKSRNVAALDRGEIYHLGVIFHTTPEGAITMDVCLQSGTGPMGASTSVVTTVNGFSVAASDGRATAEKLNIKLGQNQVEQTLDIAAVRFFGATLQVFPGLDGKE